MLYHEFKTSFYFTVSIVYDVYLFFRSYLYSILTDPVISSYVPPVLIACNKHDQTMAKGAKVVQAQLEKEMWVKHMKQPHIQVKFCAVPLLYRVSF